MDDAEARAILREHGEEPPARGKLGGDWLERAESYRADAPGDEYDLGTGPGDFGPEPGEDTASVTVAAEPPADLPAEQPPRRVKRPRPTLRDRMRAPAGAKSKAKRKHPRVPVDQLISRGWEVLAGLAANVDRPLGVCLGMQAPVAGLILEDVVRGTFADRALQPIARAEDKAEKIAALTLAPLAVLGIEHAQTLPDPQRKAREAIFYPILIEGLVLGERVAGHYQEDVLERARRDGPARERAEQLAGMIFSAAPEPAKDTAAA